MRTFDLSDLHTCSSSVTKKVFKTMESKKLRKYLRQNSQATNNFRKSTTATTICLCIGNPSDQRIHGMKNLASESKRFA